MRGAGAIWWVCLLSVLASPVMSGHPHDERRIVLLRGTVTKVDVANRAVEVDTVDPTTKQTHNILVLLDKKAKLRRGKTRIEPSDLKVGQQVMATVELTHDETQAERFIALGIQIE